MTTVAAPGSSAHLTLLRLAWRPLGLAALLLAAAAALAWRVQLREETARAALVSATARQQAAAAGLAEAQDARSRLEANLRQFEQLERSGFVGMPDRVGLLESLEQAGRLFASAPLRWTLGSSEPLERLADAQTGTPVAQLGAIPMQLESDQLHEEEWLALLARLRASASGQPRVQSCSWERTSGSLGAPRAAGVRGRCELLWLHVEPLAEMQQEKS